MASLIEKRASLHKCVDKQRGEISQMRTQLTQLQHLANIGTVSHMIAHEINNLLTSVKSYGTLALKNIEDKPLVEKALQKAVQNSQRASAVMESMLALASGENQEKDYSELKELVNGVFTCLCRDFEKDGIVVDIQIPENLKVWCVPVQIQQVLMNLILNAHDAISGRSGILKIRASKTGDTVQIEVADTGDGIEPKDLKRIFDTFFTTKNGDGGSCERTGTGMGLAFCRSVVDAHDGLMTVESEPGQGTTFKICLPGPKSGDA